MGPAHQCSAGEKAALVSTLTERSLVLCEQVRLTRHSLNLQGDAYASDGAHGVSVYLSNACRALKNMSEVRETVSITALPPLMESTSLA